MNKPDIFISYSHQDKVYKDELLSHLRIIERQGIANFWDTNFIYAGADWDQEIIKAINNAEFAILLISPSFLNSDYIIEKELPLLFKKAELGEMVLLPILVRTTHWVSIPKLTQFQFLNDVREPLSSAAQKDEVYAKIAQKINELILSYKNKNHKILSDISDASLTGDNKDSNKTKSSGTIKQSKNKQHVFLSHSKHDGDFAELMKLRLEKEGIDAWIDNDRLEPGIDWRQEIDVAIRNAKSLIAIMSPEARESEYVTYEWAYAWGCGINLIPIMLKETPLHPRLAALQYLDFTNRRARPWDQLVKTINRSEENKKE